MVTVSIVIDQSGHPVGYPGQSRDDLSLSVPVELSNYENSGVTTWAWTLLARPSGSLASLDTPSLQTCRFTPDVTGSYLIQLVLNGRVQATIVAAVKTSYLGLRIPAVSETVEMDGWSAAIQTIIKQLEDGIQSGGGGDLTARVEALEVANDDAFHRSIASEIYLLDEKLVPEDTDVLVIEDSTDGALKKRIQIGNLPAGGGGGGFNWTTITEITAADSPYYASVGELVLVVGPWEDNVTVILPAASEEDHLKLVGVKVIAAGAVNTVDVLPYPGDGTGDSLDDAGGGGLGVAHVHGWNTGSGAAEAGCCIFQCYGIGTSAPRYITLAHYYRVMVE